MSDRTPAETFPPGLFLAEELEARGWTSADLAMRMGGATDHDIAVDQCSVDLLLHIHNPDLLMGEEMANKLASALGGGADYWINLDRAWRSGGRA